MNVPNLGATRVRALAFLIVVAACAAGIAAYMLRVAHRSQAQAGGAATSELVEASALPAAGAGRTSPFVVFRGTALGASYGRVMWASLDSPDGPRRFGPLACERLHYAAGSGVCLQADRGAVTTYRATLFDERFSVRKSIALAGPPSRARVSPDGRRVAVTVFINGHAYSNPGFTTRTSMLNAHSGDMIVEDLETWPVVRDGAPFKATDFNFWGITFSHDPARFYATLGTAGVTYLVEGDMTTRRLRVVADNVECPSLSPDDRRVAFKFRDPDRPQGRIVWHPAVLDLATGRVTVLRAEKRSVDDQIEWNGPGEILYGLPVDMQQSSASTDVWALATDGASPPRRLLAFAYSPAVNR